MSPTEILKEEHKVVLLVLQGAANEAQNIQKTGEVNFEKIEKIIEFSRFFTDGCHHAKEEQLLFPKMGERGFQADSGPVAVMLMEHIEGRKFIGQMEENLEKVKNGDDTAKDKLVESLMGYIVLLTNHIHKENNILFNMADKVLTANDKEELLKEFDRIEKEETGEGTHEKFHQYAHDIAGK